MPVTMFVGLTKEETELILAALNLAKKHTRENEKVFLKIRKLIKKLS